MLYFQWIFHASFFSFPSAFWNQKKVGLQYWLLKSFWCKNMFLPFLNNITLNKDRVNLSKLLNLLMKSIFPWKYLKIYTPVSNIFLLIYIIQKLTTSLCSQYFVQKWLFESVYCHAFSHPEQYGVWHACFYKHTSSSKC